MGQPFPDSERFAAAAGALGIGDGVRVVVYDQHDGYWATRFWWHLRLEGFDDDKIVLVNVLDAATYRGDSSTYPRPGHIPGSINLPVSEIRDPDTGTLRPVEELRALFDAAGLLDPGVTPVTYCGGGIAATGVAHALALAGRDDVAVYDGSLTAWTADPALPLVTGDSPR